MKIASSIPISSEMNKSTEKMTSLKFSYGGMPEQIQPQRPKTKSSNTIRIKNKSNGFKIHHESRKNLIMAQNNFVFDKHPQSSATSIKEELLFLKDLIKKKKQLPQRSFSQTNFIESEELHRNYVPKPDQQSSLQGLQFHSKPLPKNMDEYKHYDMMVRDLLSEMQTRKKNSEKKKRPSISPSKYSAAKSKLLSRMIPGECNFKGLIKVNCKKQNMVFRTQDFLADNIYQKKITSYVLFLFKVNYTNAIYVDLSLGSHPNSTNKKDKVRWKVKIGRGNNCALVKSLIKRRFWLEILTNDDKEEPNFVWTQATIDSHHRQQNCVLKKTSEEIQKERFPLIKRKLKNPIKNKNFEADENMSQKLFRFDPMEESIQVQKLFYASNNGSYSNIFKIYKPSIVTNHIPLNYFIGSKKILFMLMFWYYDKIKKINPFTVLPKTYHIKSGDPYNNDEFKMFKQKEGSKVDQVWIVKPGENTNRGVGITVATLPEIDRIIKKKQTHRNGELKTFIIQQYLKPFLYNGRKFDIRHFLLITSVNGYIKAYWYREGYIRTSSEKYDLEDLSNEFVHLTNDAIQKKSEYYGKYQQGNKVSYQHFQRYLDQNYPHRKYSFFDSILPKMKQITQEMIQASFIFMDPERKENNFELYGMDFMIDSKFNPYLIEVNANPCLETSCPLLERIVPIVVEHSFRLGLDPLFPPPQHYPANYRYQLSDRMLEKLKYEIIFDEKCEGSKIRPQLEQSKHKFLQTLFNSQKNKKSKGPQFQVDEEIYDNDGEQIQDIDLQ